MNATHSNRESVAAHDHSAVATLQPNASSSSPLHWSETLRDGTHVLVRPIQKDDAELESVFIERLSEKSRRQRFLGSVHASAALVRQLTDIDYVRDMAFVALAHQDGERRIVGVSRYSTSLDVKACECAITVADDWQNHGLGTLLMRHLIAYARERGFCSMISIDSAANLQMRELAHALGFVGHSDPDDASQMIYRLAL